MEFIYWLFEIPSNIFLIGFNVIIWSLIIYWIVDTIKEYWER